MVLLHVTPGPRTLNLAKVRLCRGSYVPLGVARKPQPATAAVVGDLPSPALSTPTTIPRIPWYTKNGAKGSSLRVSLIGANRARSLGLVGATGPVSDSVVNMQKRFFHKGRGVINLRGLHLDSSRSLSREGLARAAFQHRDQLQHARRIVVKLGSAVITREDGCGLALGRLASIVEQVAELQNEGREMLMVTSGAVAFGKQKMREELIMSLSMRETLSPKDSLRGSEMQSLLAPRASAAVGQSGLMSLYEAMFAQYGVKVAQILITKPDFYSEETRCNLISTLNELIALNILPIINTNDAVTPPPQLDEEISRKLDIRDNDSLAARLASEVETDLLILMTDVEGIYNKPPKEDGARLFDNFSPTMLSSLEFGEKSSVGTGGMDSKVKASCYALERGTSVVICNGMSHGAIKGIVHGRKVGTFFTTNNETAVEVEVLAKNARNGSRLLQSLTPEERASTILKLAELLQSRESDILAANELDIDDAQRKGIAPSLANRLILTPSKLSSLADGLRQIARDSISMVGRVLQRSCIADNVYLQQVTVPIGVLLVIFESRPDCLPQVAALAMATGNGLLLKGGKEAFHSNKILMDLVKESLGTVGAMGAISLVTSRDDISDLLQLEGYIDLVIPRGSSDLVRSIQEQSKSIPVMGHAEGICHVYIDREADLEKAVRIVRDAKCDYPAACNAMETLLIHEDIFCNSTLFTRVCQTLQKEGVKINAGPKMASMLTFSPPVASSFKMEFSDLECTIEVVDSLRSAIDHIHRYGSSHTDVIITENNETAQQEYFEDEDESMEGAYQPAPGSPGPQGKNDSDSEEDPLDAFMAGIEKEVKKEANPSKKGVEKKEIKGVRDDIDEEDDEESYYRYIQENPNAGKQQEESEDEIEYDEDGNPIAPKKPKYIDPLPSIDHSTIDYEDFTKNFYMEHEDISALNLVQVQELRNKLGVKVTGFDAPKPVSSFGHFGFDEALMKAIRKSEYTQPTPIQAQSVPIALSGRDIIGIAKTGSGKTAAFIWPLLVHIMDQRELAPDEGPIGLILAPTRELAQQIYSEAKKFGKVYNIQVVCAYGGGSKWEQSKALEAGAEIVVATPGRMIDMIKMKATNLQRVTFLVLDEADRMFDMGFEPQVRSICDHVRLDRQTLLFSATFKKKVERLARDVLTDPIRVVQGELGEANQDVSQIVNVMSVGGHKWAWLLGHLVEFMSSGSVLIFVTKKANAEELANNLKMKEYEALLLHGDMSQYERNEVITAFKKKEKPILVATDVAARGLDIPHIRTVVNYDVARDIDTHTHRIGRTGRAGEKGSAFTLVTDKDKEFAGHLVRNLEGAAQEVPQELLDLAMQSSWFRKSRFKAGKAKVLGGRGLGFRERPGLGSSQNSNSNAGAVGYGGTGAAPGGASGYGTGVATQGPASQALAGGDPSTTGPATNRLAAMKAAFQSQYKSQFTAASFETAWINTRTGAQPSKERKRKSRWDD